MAEPGQERSFPMSADISVIEDRWEAICAGRLQRDDVLAVIDSLSERMKPRPEIRKCLLDVREAEVSLGITGEYVIGEYAARKLAGLRVALIQGAGQVKKLMEDTAFNRGLRILMVESRLDALA